MPEGDTIYRTAATLNRALAGRVITRFDTAYAHLSVVDDEEPIAGRIVESVISAGKHVLMNLSGNLVLRTHMRMNGSWHLYRPGERWRVGRSAMRVMVATDEWVAVAFNVPVAEFLRSGEVSRRSPVAQLGPDLLADTFDEDEALRRIQARAHEPIADVLLDQRAIAGIGNVYKSETLFAAGVHPFTLVEALDRATIAFVLGHARRLLQANIAPTSPAPFDYAQGSPEQRRGAQIITYGRFRRATGRADFGQGLWVYGRRGLPCRTCGTPIEAKKTGPHARGTFWCPKCQPSRHP